MLSKRCSVLLYKQHHKKARKNTLQSHECTTGHIAMQHLINLKLWNTLAAKRDLKLHCSTVRALKTHVRLLAWFSIKQNQPRTLSPQPGICSQDIFRLNLKSYSPLDATCSPDKTFMDYTDATYTVSDDQMQHAHFDTCFNSPILHCHNRLTD